MGPNVYPHTIDHGRTPTMLATLARLFVVASLAILAALTAGVTAHADPGDPSHSECRTEGNRECGPGGPDGPRPDGSCPSGGRPGVGGLGGPVCVYGSGKRGKAGEAEAPPLVIEGFNRNVAPLPPDYRDPSYAGRAAYPSSGDYSLARYGYRG